MRRQNHEEASRGVCHSHDYVDANMVMFAAGGGDAGAFASEEDFSDEQVALWNAAWDMAKVGWLTGEPVEWANGFTGDVVWRDGERFVIRQWSGHGDGADDNGRYVACRGCNELFTFVREDDESEFRDTLEEALTDFA